MGSQVREVLGTDLSSIVGKYSLPVKDEMKKLYSDMINEYKRENEIISYYKKRKLLNNKQEKILKMLKHKNNEKLLNEMKNKGRYNKEYKSLLCQYKYEDHHIKCYFLSVSGCNLCKNHLIEIPIKIRHNFGFP